MKSEPLSVPMGDMDSIGGTPTPRRQRCYFLLSVKSSGSSAVQRQLAALGSARLIEHTDHEQHETVFFTKAASILGLPQFALENSMVPYSAVGALAAMRRLIDANLTNWGRPLATEADIFAAWTAIVRSEPGDLVEKSPHHLYQPSVVHLMERYADATPELDCRFVGLVRNPIATLYSSWRRFGVRPEREEQHWCRAYTTLLNFAERRPDLVTVFRYEDLVSGATDLSPVLERRRDAEPDEQLHPRAIDKWRKDRTFGFSPCAETIAVGRRFGYTSAEMSNPNSGSWYLRREPRAMFYSAVSAMPAGAEQFARQAVKRLLRRWSSARGRPATPAR